MITFSFSAVVKGTKEKAWFYYENLEQWYRWKSDLEDICLDGAFETGVSGTMTLSGMPPLAFNLVKVVDQHSFTDISETPAGSILFEHDIIEGETGFITLKHSVSLVCEEPSDEQVNFLKQVFADVPSSVLTLKDIVEKE